MPQIYIWLVVVWNYHISKERVVIPLSPARCEMHPGGMQIVQVFGPRRRISSDNAQRRVQIRRPNYWRKAVARLRLVASGCFLVR